MTGGAAPRHVDPDLALLEGEAAGQRVTESPPHAAPSETELTYHGLPVLKEPVWKWPIPVYFHVGGVAGGAAVLGAAAQALAGRRLARLVRRARWTAAAGTAISAGLLIQDLGRPSRFALMLRVFRPTSPMNLGTWVLSTAGGLSWAAALLGERRGIAGRLGRAAGLGLGLVGLPLAGYTAVLLANTAVPVWQGTRRALPFLFIGSAMTGAGTLLELLGLDGAEARVVRRFTRIGETAELVGTFLVEAEARREPRVARPLHEGTPGRLWAGARLLTAGALALAGGRRAGRTRRIAAALLGTAGGLALRFAMIEAGRRSARDPRATFEPQRAGAHRHAAPA
jgi:formate-dependent nitrite reductase membrane component NrfD